MVVPVFGLVNESISSLISFDDEIVVAVAGFLVESLMLLLLLWLVFVSPFSAKYGVGMTAHRTLLVPPSDKDDTDDCNNRRGG